MTHIMVFNLVTAPEVHNQINLVKQVFKPEIDGGFLEIVEKTDGYGLLLRPDLPRTFNDAIKRVLWRSKECLDFAFVGNYTHRFGDYLLFMEDDVVVARNFTERVFERLQDRSIKSSTNWLFFSLYSPFDGKKDNILSDFDSCTQAIIFRSSEVPDLVDYVRSRYFEAPIDYLFRDYLRRIGKKMFYAIPNLVQHIQGYSTFADKGRNTHKSKTFQEGEFFV